MLRILGGRGDRVRAGWALCGCFLVSVLADKDN